jgi:geranylgeranyl diphosphate synthase type I
MQLAEFLEQRKEALDLRIKHILEDNGKRCAEDERTKILYDRLVSYCLREGKRLRPMLVLLGYRGYSQHEPPEAVMTIAACLEIIHCSFMVNADIIAKAQERRGKPALHKEVGMENAVILANLALTIALQSIAALEMPPQIKDKVFARILAICHDTGVGELLDLLEAKTPVSRLKAESVLKSNLLKTARYTFEGPLLLGATIAGVDQEELKLIAESALPLGEAFQLKNDLDALDKPEALKSPPRTLAIAYAYVTADAATKKELNKLMKPKADRSGLKACLEKSGALERTKLQLNSCVRKAIAAIDASGMHEEQRGILRELARQFLG